ncbi:hypothetical protein GCM10010112_54760 [Actinoplanes lobatus]|uniref:Integral membrane protein n=1 Tax=Actinoplanes lobatus TaxID=113568 RepID=A0A7W7HEX6_9ACTN|nr:hypothetical protein [Actinoplanes lobatus]MBB4749306.1 hypothetical protein [Actinoplanes lobatus]GGN79780.1 hypothetical protein GCM10010112_54760 [Actinoplanes lobatus]GIE40245.1 hypothetical protein Alo02nite_31430 [Actinoplanes lobatus]
MDRNRVALTSGLAGLAGAALWLLEAVISPPDGQSTLSSLVNIAAFLCMAGLIYGLYRLRAAGWGRFGSVMLLLWAAGHAAIAVATVISMAAGITDEENPAFAVGGLLQVVGGLLAAVAITRGTVLTGWRRWMPLVWVAYFTGLMMPVGFSGDSGTLAMIVLAGWAVPVIATASAVLTLARQTDDRGVRGAAGDGRADADPGHAHPGTRTRP